MAAETGLGFAPGQVLSGEVDLRLRTSLIGHVVHYLARVDSTNRVLSSLAAEGAPQGTVVIAEEQTSGRGRGGRPWHSPPGAGLWLSVLLKPDRPARELAPLSMATAISVTETLRRDFGVGALVKWPNDILTGEPGSRAGGESRGGAGSKLAAGRGAPVESGRKLGGILLESVQTPGGPVARLVIGIGLNVNFAEDELPPELGAVAASMSMLLGKPISRLEVLRSVLESFERDWLLFEREGFESFRERWPALSATLGGYIAVASDSESIAGTVVDISPEGALVVDDQDGARREIWHGDVTAMGRQAPAGSARAKRAGEA